MNPAEEWFEGMHAEVGGQVTFLRAGLVLYPEVRALVRRLEREADVDGQLRFVNQAREFIVLARDVPGYRHRDGDLFRIGGDDYDLPQGKIVTINDFADTTLRFVVQRIGAPE